MFRSPSIRKLRALRAPLFVVAAVALAVFAIPSAGASTSGGTEHITVIQELVQETEGQDCMGRDGMKWSRKSLPTAFEIVVTLDRPLCSAYETAQSCT